MADHVRQATRSSDFLRTVAMVTPDRGCQFALGRHQLRELVPDEISQLKNQGNHAEDWSRLRVIDDFDAATVYGSRFIGDVFLGRFAKPLTIDQTQLPSGIYNSTLAQCVVGDNALVQDVRMLSNVVVGADAILLNCGSVACTAQTTFGNGIQIPVGIETGGREVAVFAEIDVELAAWVARCRAAPELLQAYQAAVDEYVAQASSEVGIISPGAMLRDTPQIRNCYIGPYAQIEGATLVADSTLLSSQDEPVQLQSGAYIDRSIIQWGSHVTTMAIVDTSVLTEHSHAERHGKVTATILGPNSGVAEGEATACLLGPFVGFHHQALLIAVFWPEGKGNVGYGANVGSNHTSKAPDQEFWPGEGTFLGLGVNIKFPADFSRAPYSIVATGVNTLPQRISFPFSLINSPAHQIPDLSPAFNQIIPAWLLTDNMYTLKRNEAKYQSRNKATRTEFDFRVLRPHTIDLMQDARRRLTDVTPVKQVYTDRDIDGLGKNYMLETSRQAAIDAYQFYIEYYALMGLSNAVNEVMAGGIDCDVEGLLCTPTERQPWEHQRQILHDQFHFTDVVGALQRLPAMLEKIARDVQQSKAKDDHRGARIIDDYSQVHSSAEDDKFVQQTWSQTRQQLDELNQLIGQLASA